MNYSVFLYYKYWKDGGMVDATREYTTLPFTGLEIQWFV